MAVTTEKISIKLAVTIIDLTIPYLHIQVFYIGSANPKCLLHGLHPRKHFGVVGGVGDVGEHREVIHKSCFDNHRNKACFVHLLRLGGLGN